MRSVHPAAAAALAVAVLAAALSVGPLSAFDGRVEQLELWSLDLRFGVRGPQPPHPDLALVVFDDATFAKDPLLLGHRAGWARTLRALAAAGARTVAIDATFQTPEHLLGPELGEKVARWAETHPTPSASDEAALLAEVAQALRGDAEVEAALREAGNVVLMLQSAPDAQAGEGGHGLARARFAQSSHGPIRLTQVGGVVASLPRFTEVVRGGGFTNVLEDGTQSVRRVELGFEHGGGVYLAFSAAAAAAFVGVPRANLAWLGAEQQAKLGALTVPLDLNSVWLNFRGGRGTFPTYSVAQLLEGKVPSDALRDKLVLLGVTQHSYDVARTPFGRIPGVELQATAVDNLLRGDTLRRWGRAASLACLLGLGLAAVLLFASRRVGPRAQVAGLVALAAAWVAFCLVEFQLQRQWVPLVGPLATLLGGGVAGLATAYLSEARLRRRLRTDFAHYLGEDALEQLLQRPGALALGGERRTLSVLFSDIRDFTTLSEALPPDRLVALLNTYLSPMTRAVLNRGGLLDKYIGDAVMAVFGAPVPFEDHARRALSCALDMHRALQALNQGPLASFGLTLSIGVGVNTGEMVVGNMGSEERFDYTVAGDAVNLASRLEGLTKRYGVFCLVGDGARRAAGAGFTFRSLDLVQGKGKHQAVEVHELVAGDGTTVAPWTQLEAWEQAVADFRAGRLGEARRGFQAFAAANPQDAAAQACLARLAGLPDAAPEGFSPVTVFDAK